MTTFICYGMQLSHKRYRVSFLPLYNLTIIFWLHIILRKLSRLWKSTIIVEDKYNCTTAIDDAGEDEDDSIVCSRQRSEVMIGVSRSWLMIPIPNNEQHVPQQPNKHYSRKEAETSSFFFYKTATIATNRYDGHHHCRYEDVPDDE